MPYAQVASSGSQKQKFYNENMLVCMTGKISYEKLAEKLILEGYWKSNWISNRKFALVFNFNLCDRLITTIDSTHVMFNYRRRAQMDTSIRVFVSRFPIGKKKTEQVIESVFEI